MREGTAPASSRAPAADFGMTLSAGGGRGGGASAAAGLKWSKVQDFKTQEEALRFVMECQPIDYRPVEDGLDDKPFPRFESTRDAFEFARKMEPWPSEFVSVEPTFRRHLRIRKIEQTELRMPTSGAVSSRRMSARKSMALNRGVARGSRLVDAILTVKEVNPWLVEAAGSLFERPESLRDLHKDATLQKYFVAVAPEIEKKVLAEGFRVKRRCSIPCSATPKEARHAFQRATSGGEQQGRRPTSPRASVLAVTLPPDSGIDVVAHREGGFLIRCKELPASCFSRVRRQGGL